MIVSALLDMIKTWKSSFECITKDWSQGACALSVKEGRREEEKEKKSSQLFYPVQIDSWNHVSWNHTISGSVAKNSADMLSNFRSECVYLTACVCVCVCVCVEVMFVCVRIRKLWQTLVM